MARKNLIRSNFYPYHVVNRTLDQKFYKVDRKLLWGIYTDCLGILSAIYGLRIHAFVLMGNHYHLLVSTPDENLDVAIRYLQTEVSKAVADYTRSSSFCYDSRYKWSIIYNSAHYMNVIRYIYQNPIRAGISRDVYGYELSSLHGQLGYSRLDVPLCLHELQADFYIDSLELDEFEKWVNEPLVETDLKQIRAALRRFEFKYSKNVARECKKVAGTCKKVAGTVQK